MSLITKPSELKSNLVLKGLIYGQPGIGKTTLALSANNPLLIDFDKGLHRVAPAYRKDSLQVESFRQVLELLSSEEISDYQTIVIDTLGKLIDRIADYCAELNPKIRQSDGQLSMKGWGAVKGQFLALLKLLDSKNKSIIFVAHETEEKDDDKTKKRPDCSGSARKDIVKELDFMGYMSMAGSKRVIDFSPTEGYYAKNSIGLEGSIEVSQVKGQNDFLIKNIFEVSKRRIQEQSELAGKFEQLRMVLDDRIASLSTLEEVNNYYKNDYQKLERVWSSFEYEQVKLLEKVKELGFEFDKKTKTFFDPKASVDAPKNPEFNPELIMAG
jgi:phage nucleotide-binding protein